MKILITGATGSLGSSLIKEALERNYEIVCLGHSERQIQKLQSKYPNIPFYSLDIFDKHSLANVVDRHGVDYIIHTAAMKHIGICEHNPTKAVEINILGSKNIVEVANQFNIKNVIAVSTDKAINPSCVYGCSKLLMEKIMLEHGYATIQSVNLFFSSGSVLKIWDRAIKEKEPIKINTEDTTRYFIETSNVANKILDSLDCKGQYISLEKCYRVSLHQLAKAFCNYHGYNNTADYKSISAEKIEEEVPQNMKIIDTDQSSLEVLLKEYYNSNVAGD